MDRFIDKMMDIIVILMGLVALSILAITGCIAWRIFIEMIANA